MRKNLPVRFLIIIIFNLLLLIVVKFSFAFNIRVHDKFANVKFESINILYSNMTEKEFVFKNQGEFKNLYLRLVSPKVSGKILIESDPSVFFEEEGSDYKILKNKELFVKAIIPAFNGTKILYIKDKQSKKFLLTIKLEGIIETNFKQRTSVNFNNEGVVRVYHDIRYKNNLMFGAGISGGGNNKDIKSDFHISYQW